MFILPVIIFYLIFNPGTWLFCCLFVLFSTINFIFIILTKYSTYRPNERLAENAERLGKIFRSEFSNIKSDMVELVRGKGLLNAVVIKPKNGKEAWDVCLAMKDKGLIAKPTHNHIIRFAPPLIITEKQLMEAIGLIKDAFKLFE